MICTIVVAIVGCRALPHVIGVWVKASLSHSSIVDASSLGLVPRGSFEARRISRRLLYDDTCLYRSTEVPLGK